MPFSRRMQSLPLAQVKLNDPFWSRWQRLLVEVTLPHEYDQLVKTDRIANFRRAAGKEEGTFDGYYFNDSDVYKWAEACAYALVHQDSNEIRGWLDEAITAIVGAQEPDGYLNTFFQLRHPDLKWRNLNSLHEMYCGGHLIEAGVALFECLGDRRLLDVGVRFADHVMSIFGLGKRRGYCGHQEIELALLRLAHATGEQKYAEFARWMVEERGKRPSPFEAELLDEESVKLQPWAKRGLMPEGEYNGDYCQDHAPIREQTEVVGHAVRAMYFYIAATELADGQNDADLEKALERIWNNLTGRRMYVTGGIGPSASNEGFTRDFDLPNLSAYAETCAAIGLVFWGHKMLEMTGDSDYADIMERSLYNGSLSGISLSGDRFFYANPLESRGTHGRVPWYDCACCPPNIARLIGNLGSYVCGASDDTFYVHMPVGLEATCVLAGSNVGLRVISEYPWSGKVEVHVSPESDVEFTIAVRVPGWCDNVESDWPGDEQAEFEAGYMLFKRKWQTGDVLRLDFEMQPKWVEADPRVRDDLGRVALTRGPIVYCAEQHDAEFAPQLFVADVNAELEPRREEMLGGMTTIEATGMCEVELFPDQLYGEVGTTDMREAAVKFIPYYAWNNRGATNMQVWVRWS